MVRTLKLNKKVLIEIKPKAPFDFDATVCKPSRFPTLDYIWEKSKNLLGKIRWLEKEIRL